MRRTVDATAADILDVLTCPLGELAIEHKVLKRLKESLTADYTSHAVVADILYSQVALVLV